MNVEGVRSYLNECLAVDGDRLESFVLVAQYLSGEGESQSFVLYDVGSSTVPQTVGLLELAKFDVMGDHKIGPHDDHWTEEDE